MVNTATAAIELGVSVWTVHRLIRTGELAGVVPGKRGYRIPLDAVRARITPRPQAPTSPAVPATCSVAGQAAPIEGELA